MTDAAPTRRNGTTIPPEHPWDRQPNEGPEAYEAFTTYLSQDRAERSLRRAARTLDKNMTTLGQWSSRHGWVRRVSAYDRHMDEQRRREREGAILEMERRQATQLAAGRQMLMAPVQAFLERMAARREAGEKVFGNVSDEGLARLATTAIRHLSSVVESERLVAGLSTQNVQPDAPGSSEELRRRAESMPRSELEAYLVGVDDGRRAGALEAIGVPAEGAEAAEGSP